MKRKDFDLLETEIGIGPILIEASAGTGKTYTIAGLVLRLLLERSELTIDRILVTTFTELATAELRGRIRDLLRRALDAFQRGKSNDNLIAAMLRKHSDYRAAATRLNNALVDFDEAPIYTIHGFCQRVLGERAFETGTLFDAELVTDERELLHEIASDFWRRRFYVGDSLGTLLALHGKITPRRLFTDLEDLVKNPTLTILPEDLRDPEAAAESAREALEELRAIWPVEAESIRSLFANPAWAKGAYKDAAVLGRMLDDLESCLSAGGGTVRQLASVEMLAKREISKGVRAKHSLPQQRTFDACEKFSDRAAEFCVALRAEFHAWAPEELRWRKQERNVLAFEDLLTRLDDALRGEGGAAVAQSIRDKYGAALVDEFQDTDPVQYSIFQRIYGGSDATVALIGDPKQAIYAFRGADVFTYLQAARQTQRQFTLRTNWRSESRLVRAVNAIFDRPASFLLDEIAFPTAEPGPRADQKPLLVDGKKETPFHIWTAADEKQLPEAVASEIVRLLARGATIDGEKLEPGHLAVLTSTNAQAAEMQQALRDRRVPSVLYSSANVFASREARELRDALTAVAQPGNEKLIRAALCTDALGHTGNEVDELSRDDVAWETEFLRFQKYHELWRDRGFIQMLRHLAAEQGVRQRLLGFPDGERRLTNFLHLSELLHAACVENRLGMTGMLKWLAQQLQGGNTAFREEYEMRLESDEKAVRIITVHKSKGLEFDVVFCPYVCGDAKSRAAFHDPEANDRLTLDLAGGDRHKPRQEKEALAEALRLFYVAVTRAKHRCTMVWRENANPERTAPAYLLGKAERPAMPSSDIAITEVPRSSDDTYRIAQESPAHLTAREFTGTIDRSWGIASFTRLISAREADELDEGPPVEIATEEEEVAVDVTGIHAFPRGMRVGTCLHEILELVDFSHPDSVAEIVERRLRAYSIENFDEVIAENVHALAALPLVSETDRFTLAGVPNEKRIAELEFSFPIDSLTNSRLAQVLQLPEVALRLDRLQFQMMNGFMNGFIDLIFEHGGRFYIIDWKSNWLGPKISSYSRSAVAAEMQRNFYTLQLCLYSVALHRYLRLRKPDYDFEQHFGGAFYIFLRGIDPAEPKHGVYFQRLSHGFVEKLSQVFEP